MLKEFHADRLFLAVDGFDLEAGPSTPDVLEAQLNTLMVRISKEVNVVADFSKLGRRWERLPDLSSFPGAPPNYGYACPA